MAPSLDLSLKSLSLSSDINGQLYNLLEADQFVECIKLASSTGNKPSKIYLAYAQYRLGREEECLRTLGDDQDRASLHLKAQALYRLEKVSPENLQALKTKSEVPNEEADIAVNEAAIAAQHAALSKDDTSYSIDHEDASHEQLFNYSIYLSSKGQSETAISTLQQAIRTLDSLQLDPEEYEAEVAPIQAQLAHLTSDAQLNRKSRELKSDSATRFLTGINFLEDSNPYVLYKAYHAESKLKQSARLFSYQNRYIAYDKIMVMHAAGLDIKNATNKYCSRFSTIDVERCAALRSLVYSKASKQSLKELLTKEPDNVHAAIALISKMVRQERGVTKCLEVIEQIPASTRTQHAGLIGLWCALSDLTTDSQSSKILEDALQNASGPARIELLAGAVHRSVSKVKSQKSANEADNSSALLDELLRLDPTNLTGQSARSVLQPSSSDEILPLPDLSSVDISSLEAGLKRPLDTEGDTRSVKKQKAKSAAQTEQERNLDPERWLPKRDRSNYKPTKKEKMKTKGGHQGGLVDESLSNQGPASQASKTGEIQRKKKGKKGKK